MTVKDQIAIMQAYAAGKEIQFRNLNSDKWLPLVTLDYRMWDWSTFEYRIKPEEKKPTYKPYKDTAEMIADYSNRFNDKRIPDNAMPFIWVSDPNVINSKLLITEYYNNSYGQCCVGTSFDDYTMPELFERCTYLDGTPCGKLVE